MDREIKRGEGRSEGRESVKREGERGWVESEERRKGGDALTKRCGMNFLINWSMVVHQPDIGTANVPPTNFCRCG
jgi:hypothetical protein